MVRESLDVLTEEILDLHKNLFKSFQKKDWRREKDPYI